jgi:D-serine deaminase-like pyridoxal phosphate-dependent protein
MDTTQANPKLAAGATTIHALITPTLLLDEAKLERNVRRLADHVKRLGAILRPHMKILQRRDWRKRRHSGSLEPHARLVIGRVLPRLALVCC